MVFLVKKPCRASCVLSDDDCVPNIIAHIILAICTCTKITTAFELNLIKRVWSFGSPHACD
jgi:hypothetical protein